MAACWRKLAQDPEIDLRVIAWATNSSVSQSAFQPSIMDGVSCRLVSGDKNDDVDLVSSEVNDFRPDVLVIPGWMSKAYTSCVLQLGANRPAVVMGMDTPWTGAPRQHVTRWRHYNLFKNIDRVVVAGERSWQYATRLGFAEHQIIRGVYAWDESLAAQPSNDKNRQGNFVFVGRLAREKGIETLIEAYSNYRNRSATPWTLTVCGTGPLSDLVKGEGITPVGFIQPADLSAMFRRADVMVLPSYYEPWGVALAEAMGAGLPAIATEACGAAIDLVRSYWNGIMVPTGSVTALADALEWFDDNDKRLPTMSENARVAAEPFSATNWAVRWKTLLNQLTIGKRAAA